MDIFTTMTTNCITFSTKEEKEILEDMVVAAVNKALASASKMAEEEMAKVTKGMLPPGMNIPGL